MRRTAAAWGLDRTRGGWVVARLGGRGAIEVRRVTSAADVPAGESDTVAVDIPLPPLPESIGRRCDRDARSLLAGRSATVFPALPRWCYLSPYDEATRAEARRRFGKAYSKQAWNLGPAIFDAEAAAGPGWVETHPELAFLVRNNGNPLPPKTTWDGVRERLGVLDRRGVQVPTGALMLPVPPHDVLDAVVCAVVARDLAAGEVHRVPAHPLDGESVISY